MSYVYIQTRADQSTAALPPGETRVTSTNRRQQIEALLAEEPDDQFLRYSLAMELQKDGEHEESLRRLDSLMEDDAPYLAAFFMAAKQLVGLKQIDRARRVLRAGIDQARQQGDSHTASEMAELLANLGALGE
jgi:thioredoxin-like negative regulator of GroEL